jgi:hypothetical protein
MALNGRFNDSAARQFHLHTVADFVMGMVAASYHEL